MKAYVVKAKAKLGKLPTKEICRDLLYEDNFERKLDIIRNNNSEIPNVSSKKDLEIFLSNKLYDDLNSFLKFLKGEEKEFFLKYISKFELQLMQLIVQAIINNHLDDSLDIIKRERISPWDAYFGEKITVDSPNGKFKINIPEKIEAGNKIRIKDKGYKDLKGKVGDLYIEILIDNPKDLSKDQIDLYKKLKELN